MEIGFVTPHISLSSGGIQNTSYLFAEAFRDQCKFRVITSGDSDRVAGCEDTITYCKHKREDNIGLHIDFIQALFASHQSKPFDFTFTILYPYALSCFLLKKIKRVPYGVMVHGAELMPEPKRHGVKGNIIWRMKRLLREVVLRNADIVFANSSYTEQLFKKAYGASKKTVVIHPPIKYEDKHIDVNDTEKRYVLLSLGRIVERKGFQFVIEAMPELLREIPDLKYYIAGSGPYTQQLKSRISEHHLEEHVKLLGRVSEEEKDKLYRECDIFIMPSYTIEGDGEVEGFGIVFIEANMYGKYVIGTCEGGIPDAIIEGVTGSFAVQQSTASISSTISRIYKEERMYSPLDCIEWSKEMDASLLAGNYLKAITATLN